MTGAVKTEPKLNTVLARSKTKNALYQLLFYEPTALGSLKKSVTLKVKLSLMHSKDFVIIWLVIIGP